MYFFIFLYLAFLNPYVKAVPCAPDIDIHGDIDMGNIQT